jgi:tRNA dimethylallyltransferase
MRTRTPGISSDLVNVIALFGPTGVGKTAVAIALAERLRERGEDPVAISADAIQVYRGLEVLSGAATESERARLEHRLLSFVDPRETFSAGEFAARAHGEIDSALASGRRPIVVGGTGLYLQAALTDLELRPPPDPEVRERIRAELAARGPEALHAELARRAPEAADAIDPRDRTRVGRALELLEMGEEPAPAGDESRLWTARLRHPTLLLGLTMDRERLYERIDTRVERMVAAGAAAEVERANAGNASHTARAALGFEELLRGDVEAMKRRSRNYAKRQLTWMRRLPGVHEIDLTDREAAGAASAIVHILAAQPGEARPERGEP